VWSRAGSARPLPLWYRVCDLSPGRVPSICRPQEAMVVAGPQGPSRRGFRRPHPQPTALRRRRRRLRSRWLSSRASARLKYSQSAIRRVFGLSQVGHRSWGAWGMPVCADTIAALISTIDVGLIAQHALRGSARDTHPIRRLAASSAGFTAPVEGQLELVARARLLSGWRSHRPATRRRASDRPNRRGHTRCRRLRRSRPASGCRRGTDRRSMTSSESFPS
jgi:hypothetical protein